MNPTRSWSVALILSSAACQQKTVAFPESTTTTLSMSGGVAESADGLFRVSFAAGALPSDATLTIVTLRDQSSPTLGSLVYQLDPGSAASRPAELRIKATSTTGLGLAMLAGSAAPVALSGSVGEVGAVHAPVASLVGGNYALVRSTTPPPPPPPHGAPVDILVVLDNSGSAVPYQQHLGANFDAFLDAIGSTDYRLAVVSTDLDSPNGEMSGTVHFNFSSSEPYTLDDASFDASACVATGSLHGCFRGAAGEQLVTSTLPRAEQLRRARANLNLGSCGSGTEVGLAAMQLALSNTQPTSCNQGFLRPEARLLVLIISDEDDSQDPPAEVSSFVTALMQVKAADKLRFAAITGAVGGQAERCGIGATGTPALCGSQCDHKPPEGSHQACDGRNPCATNEYCDGNSNQCQSKDLQFWDNCYWCSFYNAPDCCTALAGTRYVDFGRALEQAVHDANPAIPLSQCRPPLGGTEPAACWVDSVCQADFSATYRRIAEELIMK